MLKKAPLPDDAALLYTLQCSPSSRETQGKYRVVPDYRVSKDNWLYVLM